MGRALGYIALIVFVSVTIGLITHRVVLPVLIGGGLFLLGIFIAIGRAGSPGSES